MRNVFRRAIPPALWLLAGCSGAPNSAVTPPGGTALTPATSSIHLTGDTTKAAPLVPYVTIVQAVGGIATTGGVALVPAVPVPGDLLVIFGAVAQRVPRISSAPAGFAEITAGKDGAPDAGVCFPGRTCIANYYKIASAGEPASYEFTDDNPNARISASFVEFGGVDPVHPIVAQAWQQGHGKLLSCPPSAGGDLSVCMIADSAGSKAAILVPPSGMTSGWSLIAGTEQIPAEQSSMAFSGPPDTALSATLQSGGNAGSWAATSIALQRHVAASPSPSPLSSPSPLPTSTPIQTPLPTPSPAPTPAPRRAMWIWTTPDNAMLVAFAKANNVQEIFYSVSASISGTELTRLRNLKTLTDAARITLDALGGDPTWATTNTGDALAWETDAINTGLFAGAHFDIEPAALPAWSSNNAATIASYLAALDRIRANSPVHFEVDVPFWYGQYQAAGFRSLADAVIAKTDETSTMSYRNTATGSNSLFAVGQDMLARAQAAGKPTRLGAETNNVQPANITFYSVGNAAMQAALPQVDAAAASYTSYRGIAIEDYFGWNNLGGAGH